MIYIKRGPNGFYIQWEAHFSDKGRMDELSDVGLDLHDAIAIMQEGFVVRRGRGTLLRGPIRGGIEIINIVAVEWAITTS